MMYRTRYTDAKPQINEEGSLRRRYKVLLLHVLFCTYSVLLEHLHVCMYVCTDGTINRACVQCTGNGAGVVQEYMNASTDACVLHNTTTVFQMSSFYVRNSSFQKETPPCHNRIVFDSPTTTTTVGNRVPPTSTPPPRPFFSNRQPNARVAAYHTISG